MFEAVKVALDPSPAQGKLLASHAGGARFAYNTMLARVKVALDAGEKIDWSSYALLRWWNANKGALWPSMGAANRGGGRTRKRLTATG